MSDNAIAVIEQPRELSVIEVKAQVAKVQNLMHDLMQEGTHFGESFPGDTKKNLLKPGADKLCFMFRLRPDFIQEIKELPNAHIEVLTRCQIFHIDSGQKFAEGVGLATTMESKYRWRNSARKCPVCGKETIIKGNEKYGGGWLCYGKKGGCSAKFKDNDPLIIDQIVGKIENPDIADTYNTVIKMSKKRAYVDATITACAASDIFSQDADDFNDTAESLAREAESGEPRNVTEQPPQTSPAVPPEENNQNVEQPNVRQKKIIVAIVTEKSPDKTDYFTDEERLMAKEQIKETKGDLAKLMKITSVWQKELEKRKAAYKPVPFEDSPATAHPAETHTVKAEQAGESPKQDDDGFVDDIPWGEGEEPGKRKQKAVPENTSKELEG
jgi:hypothetical protein